MYIAFIFSNKECSNTLEIYDHKMHTGRKKQYQNEPKQHNGQPVLQQLESVGVLQILSSVPTLLTQGVKFILCELSLYYVS